MRIRSPRLFALAASILLCLPLTVGLFQAGRSDLSRSEDRPLASWPRVPRSAREWRALPAGVDAFLSDHFGLRDAMIYVKSTMAYLWLREANPDVLIGRGGRLFYYGDDAVAQSAGEVVRPAAVRHTVEVLADMQAALAARGARLVVASPPNAASVYDDDLPPWARNGGRETEADLILSALKARGLTVVDVRRTLRAARDRGNLYLRSDTHWTRLGAVIGYDAIAAAAGHADWALDPGEALGPTFLFDDGDLARMLGAGISWPETTRELTLDAGPEERLGPKGEELQVFKGVRNGPAVLVLGDSFTEGVFPALMAGHAGRIGWLSSRNCGFDWSRLAAFKPDEVWYAPTERLMLCGPDTWPKGMPRAPEKVGRAAVEDGTLR